MAWEQRQGQRFYYQNIRVNGLPQKKYIGKGDAAEVLARQVAEAEQRRAAERKALADERALLLTAEQALSDFQALVSLLSQAFLLCKDCYRHHRQWRRRRVRIDR